MKLNSTSQILFIFPQNKNSYKARAFFLEKQNGIWKCIYKNLYCFIGKNGIVKNRIQNTNTTPIGNFGFIYGFGIKDNPGTNFPYIKITNKNYWVTDSNSIFYNRMSFIYKGWDKSEEEHLIDFGYLYNYSMVIDFNYYFPIKGVGAGIFLHVAKKNSTGTSGCISLLEKDLINILKKLDKNKFPRIIITSRES